MKASSICGSDIRAIYREHLGHGPEAYQGVVAGHEPCGQVVAVGPGCRRLPCGDRVVVYHISGCGVCERVPPRLPDRLHRPVPRGVRLAARRRPRRVPARRGGHLPAAARLAVVRRRGAGLLRVRHRLRGAAPARRLRPGRPAGHRPRTGRPGRRDAGAGDGRRAGRRHRRLPGAPRLALDARPGRRRRCAADDAGRGSGADRTAGGCSATLDCSGHPAARLLALTSTATWGRCAFVGEGGSVGFDVSQTMIHKQVTLHGSWVTSIGHMEDLLRPPRPLAAAPRGRRHRPVLARRRRRGLRRSPTPAPPARW